MPKLKPLSFHSTSASGEVMRFDAPTTVGVSGVFRVTVPGVLADSLKSLRESKSISVGYEIDAKDNLIVYGNQLCDVKSAIDAAMADHLKCEVKTERIIAYSFAGQVNYYRGLDNQIHPHAGYDTQKIGQGSEGKRWGGSIPENTGVEHYSIGLYAKVIDKISYVRPSGTKIEYKAAEATDDQSFHGRLNGFLKFVSIDRRNGKLSELPYTEDSARFFYEMILGLCKISHRMETFFSNPGQVVDAIENRAGLGMVLSLTE